MRVKRLFKGLILGLFGVSFFMGMSVHAEEETTPTEPVIEETQDFEERRHSIRTARLIIDGDMYMFTFYDNWECTIAKLDNDKSEGHLIVYYEENNGVYTIYNQGESISFTINDNGFIEEYVKPLEEEVQGIKSEAESLVEEYFGWLVGIPIGAVITFLLDFYVLYKKKKAYEKDSDNMSKTSTNTGATLVALNKTNKLLEEANEENKKLRDRLDSLEANYTVLKESMITIATNDVENIKNGKAEKVCELLGE